MMSKARIKQVNGKGLLARSTFCGCCGSMYLNPRKKPEVLENPWGISVYPGKQGVELDDPKRSVNHVETPVGWVTVLTEKSWE